MGMTIMKKLMLAVAAGLALMASPALAQSLDDLYNDALAEADAGAPLLTSSGWQFRDGNVQEGCDLMEQSRLHYEKAYQDMNQMDQLVNDPANGYSADEQQKIMDWIAQQKSALDPQAQSMADIYYDKCKPQ